MTAQPEMPPAMTATMPAAAPISAERKAKLPKKGTTTVLDAGTVESRGMGTRATTRSQVSAEITNFLNGEARISVKAETRAFFTVWTFITRLPGPTWVDHHPGYLMRGMAYFPLAGALVGIGIQRAGAPKAAPAAAAQARAF